MELHQEGAAMAAEFRDLRAKITERADQVLEAHSLARNLDKSELVREVLDEWAAKEIHIATLVARLTRGNGSSGN